jgi:hypothetical protein
MDRHHRYFRSACRRFGQRDGCEQAMFWLARREGLGGRFARAGTQPLLMDNQCEALKSRELRLLLLEIPQEEEDPMALSLGAKSNGVVLRFKIPFSF